MPDRSNSHGEVDERLKPGRILVKNQHVEEVNVIKMLVFHIGTLNGYRVMAPESSLVIARIVKGSPASTC